MPYVLCIFIVNVLCCGRMSDKRRRRELGDGTDDEDDLDDDARDSVDLDAETEAQRRRDMAQIQAGWNQRVDLMRQTIASLRDPTVVRAMQMILNLGLVSPKIGRAHV